MAALDNAGTVGAPTSLEKKWHKVVYDFSVDGGAAGAFDAFTADGAVIITDYVSHVDTACTSGGSMTLDVGVTGDTNAFEADTAVAALTAGAVSGGATLPKKLADGEKVLVEIKTADLTAGKITVMIGVVKAGL